MECKRDIELEIEIINNFFIKTKKDRVLFLLNKGSRIDEIFGYLQYNYLDKRKMNKILQNWIREQDIFIELSKEGKYKNPYLFSDRFKGFVSLAELCDYNIMELDEVLIYFGNGKGYLQGHFQFSSRDRFILNI